GDAKIGGKWNHRKRGPAGDHDDARRDDEYRLVHERRDPVFLEEDLDHVGNHLQNAERPRAVGSVAILPQAQHAALDPDQQGGNQHDADEDDQDLNQLDEDVEQTHGLISTGRRRPCTGSRPTGTPMVLSGRLESMATGSLQVSPSMLSSSRSCAATASALAAASFSVNQALAMRSRMAGARADNASEPKMR